MWKFNVVLVILFCSIHAKVFCLLKRIRTGIFGGCPHSWIFSNFSFGNIKLNKAANQQVLTILIIQPLPNEQKN